METHRGHKLRRGTHAHTTFDSIELWDKFEFRRRTRETGIAGQTSGSYTNV